jgi:hypothetical protein
LPNLSIATGAQFVAIIIEEEGSHFVDCFLRCAPPATGFASEVEAVYTNHNIGLPSFPPMTRQQAREIAIDRAHDRGYAEGEIIWE